MMKCPICGAENALKKVNTEYKATYSFKTHSTELNSYECSCCGANLDLDYEEQNEVAIKEATSIARNNCISEILEKLEKTNSFVEIERSLYLPPKTLSKWKNQSKAPSAAAAALVSLLGVFPWLSYVGMLNYNLADAYKIAYAAILKKASEEPDNFIFSMSNDFYNGIAVVHQKNTTYKMNSSDNKIANDNYSEVSKSSTVSYIGNVL